MVTDCPYCGKAVTIDDALASGWYTCPYESCAKPFFFDKAELRLRKQDEESPGSTQQMRNEDIQTLLAAFDEALQDEIRAVKSRAGDRSIVLKEGVLVGEIAGGGIYRFDTERRLPLPDESPVQIEIHGAKYQASIVTFGEFSVDIYVAGFNDDYIPFAVLQVDATFVLRRLQEALSSSNSEFWNRGLALETFNRAHPKCCVGKPVFTLEDKDGKGLDHYQFAAMERCLGNEVSFVHGPPGTGKTRTLVNVVNDLANRGQRVLVACHTNIACDNVAETLAHYQHEPTVGKLLEEGQTVRIGIPSLPSEGVKRLTVDEVRNHLSSALENERGRLSKRMGYLAKRLDKYRQYRDIVLQCEDISRVMGNCEESIRASRNRLDQYLGDEIELERLTSERKQLLSVVEKRNPIVNFFRGTNPSQIRRWVDELNDGMAEAVKNRTGESEQLGLLLAELEKHRCAFSRRLASVPKNIRRRQTLEAVLERAEVRLEETKEELSHVEDRISGLDEGIIDNAKVVISTLSKTFIDPFLIGSTFDVVVIDEASIAPLPMLFYVCSLARQKVLVFGDPRQLAPIALADTPAAKRWLKRDIFVEAEAGTERRDDPRISRLRDQYRMSDDIFEIVNEFYNGELRNKKVDDVSQGHRYATLQPKPGCGVVIVDTSNANAFMSSEKLGPRAWSRYNLYHVQVVDRLVHHVIEANSVKEKGIGVLTPYRSQANFLRNAMRDSGLTSIEVGTVHRYQGREKEYVIFDLVEAPGGQRISPLVNDRHERHLANADSENEALRLLAVALSRPREKLVVVSHARHMLDNLPLDSRLRSVMAALTSGGAVVDGSSLVPYYVSLESQPDIAVLSQGELFQKELMFNQRSFYPHLVQDLNQAASTVVVISPYMSTRRVAQLLPHFQSLLSRGVNIKIFTKPPREQLSRQQEVEELHRHLTRMGIAVYQQYGTHEKVVAIDGQISYQGSLNTLSHSSTKEMMIRTDSPLRLQKMFSVLANNHPQLRDCLTGIGYTPEDVVDLAPEKLLNIVDSVRPKRRGLPSTPSEAREYYSTMFTKLRWVIADDKRIPNFAVLFGKTVAAMLETAPETVEDLLELPEFHRNRSNVRGYESIILEILSEYRRLIAAGEGLRPRLLACPWPSP